MAEVLSDTGKAFWASWTLTVTADDATDNDIKLDKAQLEQAISDQTSSDDAGNTCEVEFQWKEVNKKLFLLSVFMSCTRPDGAKLPERIAVRPPASVRPPAGRVSSSVQSPSIASEL